MLTEFFGHRYDSAPFLALPAAFSPLRPISVPFIVAEKAPSPEGADPNAVPNAKPKSKKKTVILGAVGVLVLLGGVAAFLLRGGGELPSEKIAKALELLDEAETSNDARMRIRALLADIEKVKYVDPDFPAVGSFVDGMLHYYEARELIGDDQQPKFLKAIAKFEDVKLRPMKFEYVDQLTYVLGVSLQMVGLRTQARPELEEAFRSYEPGRKEAGLLLLANYLEEQTPETLEKALQLSEELKKLEDLSDEQKEQITIQRAQALQQLGRSEEAEQLLSASSSPTGVTHEATIVRARSMMAEADLLLRQQDRKRAEARYNEARTALATLFKPLVPDSVVARAMFLSARCALRAGNTEQAIDFYEQTQRKFERSHEGHAATVELATVFRKQGRTEEALSNYQAALKAISRPEEFCNRWISRQEFQRVIMDAWNEWMSQSKFQEALAIAERMAPVFDHLRSRELVCTTRQKWVDRLQADHDSLTVDKRKGVVDELRQRWAECGKAYEELAHIVRFTNRYETTLWQGTECYAKGHQFEKSMQLTDEYLAAGPKQGVPRAHVHRGQMLMHLDQRKAALDDLEFVSKFYPTDPAVFEAQLWAGYAKLEQDKPAEAVKAWRTLLSSAELDPTAKEWRLAKFALSQLLVELAANERTKAQPRDDNPPTEAQQAARTQSYFYITEAIRHLDEYVRRYPQGEDRFQARELLVRALRAAAAEPREQLLATLPASARAQLHKEIARYLTRALTELRTLQDDLQLLQTSGRLDDVGQQIYRDTFVSIPDVLFEQELFEDAVDFYRTVTNRFPDHPMALTAYVQMARCLERLGKPKDALEQLEQAKLTLNRIPDDAFRPSNSGLDRNEWTAWLDWASKVRERPL